MHNLTLLKLDRFVWLSILDEGNIIEAFNQFQIYIEKLNNSDIQSVNDEIELSKKLFQDKLIEFGNKYLNEQNFSKAASIFSFAIKNNSNDISSIKNFITCLYELKQYDLFLSFLEYLEQFAVNDIEIYKFLAENYAKRNIYNKSITFMEKYINNKNEQVDAYDYNLLGYYYDVNYFTLNDISYRKIGLQFYQKASDMAPNIRLFTKNVIVVAFFLNDLETCRKYWNRLFEINELSNEDKFDFGMFSLKSGDFSQWHKYFHYRFSREVEPLYFPKINNTEWDGIEDLTNSNLLVYYEQGFGDTFLMWGYVSRLVKCVKKLIFVVQDEAYELLKNNSFGAEVLGESQTNLEQIDFDFYIPSMSIPKVLKLDRNNISVGQGYIKPDINLIKKFKKQFFNNNKFKLGLSVSGLKDGNNSRDIPLNKFLELDKLENIEIYNFTKDIKNSDLEIFENNKIVNLAEHFQNFADTAAALANCDIVLTGDNCILNLAGAVGVKTFAFFNWKCHSRWFDLTGENVVWYTCVKPYVCKNMDEWQSAITPAIEDVQKLI